MDSIDSVDILLIFQLYLLITDSIQIWSVTIDRQNIDILKINLLINIHLFYLN